MDSWSPTQYQRFATERRQPFDALVALCEPGRGGLAYDFGCGSGELTRELPGRLGVSRVVGVDSSPAMLERAAQYADESSSFVQGDLVTFMGSTPADIIVSNAALHWVADHAAVLSHWRAQLVPGGQMAVQLPCNGDHPAYQAIGITVAEQRERFAGPLPSVASAENVLSVERYVEILHGLGATELNVHMRVFPHVLTGPLEVIEWVSGTAVLPVRVALNDEAAYGAFLSSYEARLRRILGPPDMPYLFTFKRIFLWARFDTSPAAG